MLKRLTSLFGFMLLAFVAPAWADKYQDTLDLFRNAGESANYVDSAYAYAVFPTIGKVGVGIGAAHGDGRVFRGGQFIGDTSMTQLSVGAQVGAEGYSEIIFFEDERALRDFTSGHFAFEAGAQAVALTAAAGAKASTTGSSAVASAGKHDARTRGKYHKGMATFTIAKGGLMLDASVAGQRFSWYPAS